MSQARPARALRLAFTPPPPLDALPVVLRSHWRRPRRRPCRRRPGPLVVALVLASIIALGCLGALWVPFTRTVPAAAADPEVFVAIRLTSLSPALPKRSSTITVTGRVTNTSTVELSNLQAIFWRSMDPIQTEQGMSQALAAPALEPIGSRVSETNYQNIPSSKDRTLAPGESTRFTLKVPVRLLTLPSLDGVYLVGVHVRGRTIPNGPDITLGRARVFLPMVASPPANTLQLTSLVQLTSRPSLLQKGVLGDDHLAAELEPGGRLSALLQAARQPGTSFAVDPALVIEAETMRAGYQVRAADGSLSAGLGTAAATRWLNDLDDLIASGDGFRLLFGAPDVAALVHAGREDLLEAAGAEGRRVGRTADLPLVAVPTGGLADLATVTALAALHPAAIVLDQATTQSSWPLLLGPQNIPVVNVATAAQVGGPGPDPRDTPVHVRQHTLAAAWVEAATAPAGSTLGEVRLVSGAAAARGSEQPLRAPWVRSVTLRELLDGNPLIWPARYDYPDAARARELKPSQLAGERRVEDGFATVGKLLVQPGDATAEATAAGLRLVSESWRGRLTAWRAYAGPQQARLDAILRDGLVVVATPKVVTSAHRGQFPITVKNTLTPDPADPLRNAVRVRLVFVSGQGQRLSVAAIDIPEIRAGETFTDNAEVEAQSNGTVDVSARLLTADGTPIGRPVTIGVDATQAGTIGWIIVVSAGVVLLGTTALRIRQVRRERGRPVAPELGVLPAAQVVPPPAPPAQRELIDD